MKKIQPRTRNGVRGGESQFERAARQRSRRARAHLERARNRNRSRARSASPARTRAWIAIAFALSLGVGMWLGGPALDRALTLRGAAPRVATIDVLGNDRLAAREVAQATGLRRGTPIAEIEPAVVEARLAGHAWIAEARVVGLPNGAVVVWIEERVPVAVLRASGAAPRLVDEHGVVFAPLGGDASGMTHGLVSVRAGQHNADAETLRSAIALGRKLAASTAFAADRGDFEVLLPSPGDPTGWRAQRVGTDPSASLEVVLGAAPFDAQLERLSQLFAQAPQDAFAAGAIDLRFADQAVLRTRLASR